MLTCLSKPLTVVESLRLALGRLEDEVAATGWAWDRARSLRLDELIRRLDEARV